MKHIIAASILAGLSLAEKTLVLLDNWATIDTHSVFFDQLQTDGQELTYSIVGEAPDIKYYDEYFYDNIVLMAPSTKELNGSVAKSSLIEFLQENHNIIVFANQESRIQTRQLANQFGIDFEEPGYTLWDQEYPTTSEQANRGETINSKNLFSPLRQGNVFSVPSDPVAFKGIGHVIDPKNQYVFPILRAEPSTYSHNQETHKSSQVSGEHLALVSGYQTRVNSRVALSGSIDICSDKFIAQTQAKKGDNESSSNFKFCKELSQWAFQKRGVLKIANIRHAKRGETFAKQNPENYKIKQDIQFAVDVFEKDIETNKWVAFSSKDMQLEFVMLDPWYRNNLKQERATSTYKTEFTAPDHLGIFKFKINYSRYGYTFIDEEQEVSVIQFRHDEFPRFITKAFPYYASVFLTMSGFFVFVFYFMYSDYEK